MVSKEPSHSLTGQTNGKSALADKLPGTMTVRSVLLNRDSPDIESRLKKRRNRTHQVRFKDLEDGSSSSGNSGTGENNSHPRPNPDCDSPHPLRRHGSRTPLPWESHSSLPGQTSVVGAVRGDMASTIEVVAAFLARAPPHPLTPGPSRRCWTPPQANSLTLPMTRKTSTSTAIQTSPCLKKPLSTHTRSHSLGDSVGIDGDDEHDSQDEYFIHNHTAAHKSKDLNGPTTEPTVKEQRTKSRTEMKSAVVVRNSRHSCPPSVSHSEPCHCSSVLCREGPKRPGSSTPSVVRRRKRLSRTTSDPGKEVHYCTTPTQTESHSLSPPRSGTKLCTTQVQTDSPPLGPDAKCSTKPSQTESHTQSSPGIEKACTKNETTVATNPALPPDANQSATQASTKSSSCPAPTVPSIEPCTTQLQTKSPCVSPTTATTSPNAMQTQSERLKPSLGKHQDLPPTQTTSVPYCTTPLPSRIPTPVPELSASLVCPSVEIPIPSPQMPLSTPALTTAVTPQTEPNCSMVASPSTPDAAVLLPVSSCNTLSVTQNCIPPISNIAPPVSVPRTSTPVPNVSPIVPFTETTRHIPTPANVIPVLPIAPSPTNFTPCTFVTQTAISCTSISYYTTTHPVGPTGPHSVILPPAYATLVQTVSHCNIPCQVLQNSSMISTKLTPYSSPVPKLKSCTSPPILVKTYTSNLPLVQHCATPTKMAPLYSSTFRAAPPYTPPCQAQDKKGIRLPPPPPPPPPYTPRKITNDKPAPKTTALRTDGKASDKEKDGSKEKKEDQKLKDSPKPGVRASSLKHRAQTPPVALMKGGGSPAKACFRPSCLSSAQAQLQVLHKMLCSGARPTTPNSQFTLPSGQGCSGARRRSVPADCSVAGPLTPAQADTLRQVQEILGGLMSGAKCKLDPSKVTEKLLSPNGPLRDIRSLQNQLQSLEGVLETSQNTIKVLLDVIQDLEKKEAVRDGRHLYRTGQDIENCGTCRDCACIIYSVEHDFRLQEGQVVRTWKVGDPPEARPQTPTPPPSTPHTPHKPHTPPQDSPQAERTVSAKKNRKKCFWFL